MATDYLKASSDSSFYEQVVNVSRVYLGSVADRFIDRQVEYHLNKPAKELCKTDMDKLIDWIRAGVSYLTSDTNLVQEYTMALSKLSKSTNPHAKV